VKLPSEAFLGANAGTDCFIIVFVVVANDHQKELTVPLLEVCAIAFGSLVIIGSVVTICLNRMPEHEGLKPLKGWNNDDPENPPSPRYGGKR
jgi:hypothetical protein